MRVAYVRSPLMKDGHLIAPFARLIVFSMLPNNKCNVLLPCDGLVQVICMGVVVPFLDRQGREAGLKEHGKGLIKSRVA